MVAKFEHERVELVLVNNASVAARIPGIFIICANKQPLWLDGN